MYYRFDKWITNNSTDPLPVFSFYLFLIAYILPIIIKEALYVTRVSPAGKILQEFNINFFIYIFFSRQRTREFFFSRELTNVSSWKSTSWVLYETHLGVVPWEFEYNELFWIFIDALLHGRETRDSRSGEAEARE